MSSTWAQTMQGTAAEYLVCLDLQKQGYDAFLTNQGMKYDVVVDVHGKLYRLQVKSCAKVTLESGSRNWTYKFRLTKTSGRTRTAISASNADFLALVAFDIGAVAYMPISDELPKAIKLRPPGTVKTNWMKQPNNIDEFSFTKLLKELAE